MRKNEGGKTPSGVIADELEGWASGAYAAEKLPDILSATEVVAEHWQAIVAALREPITVTDADIEAGAVAVNAVKSESGKWSHEFARKIARAAIEAALKVRSEE